MSKRWLWLVGFVIVLGAAACDDSSDAGADGGGGDSGGGDSGGGDVCAAGPTVDPMSTQASAGTGTVRGKVSWSGDPEVPAGRAAEGDLHVVALEVFSTSCPDPSNPPPMPLAATLVHCADFGTGGEVEYEIHGVPLGSELRIVPFLDVDLNVDPTDPLLTGPSGCDLAGLAEVVTVDSEAAPGEVDLSLSTPGSFIAAMCGGEACEAE